MRVRSGSSWERRDRALRLRLRHVRRGLPRDRSSYRPGRFTGRSRGARALSCPTFDSTSTRSPSRSPTRHTCRRPHPRAPPCHARASRTPLGKVPGGRSSPKTGGADQSGPRDQPRSRHVAPARSRLARAGPPRYATGLARVRRIAGGEAHACPASCLSATARPSSTGISSRSARLPMRSWRSTTAAPTAPRRFWKGRMAWKSSTRRRRATRMPGGTDRRNRQILLEAARERGFDWVFYLDADERISSDDAVAVCSLIDATADSEHAYGFLGLWHDRTPHLRSRRALGVPPLRHSRPRRPPEGTSPSGACPALDRARGPQSARRSGFSTSGAVLPPAGSRAPASTTRRTLSASGKRATRI